MYGAGLCIIGNGLSLSDLDDSAMKAVNDAISFGFAIGGVVPYYVNYEDVWNSGDAARAICQVDPSSRICVAKVCEKLDNKTPATTVAKVSKKEAV
jgi:hypothetical protein